MDINGMKITDVVVYPVKTKQENSKLFAFAKDQKLSKQETLNCFGEHYKNVLDTPEGDNHENIRNFISHGWEGVSFNKEALIHK